MEPTRARKETSACRWLGLTLTAVVLTNPASAGTVTRAPAPEVVSRISVTTLVKGLDRPWSFGFLPDGGIIVTEIGGRMRLVDRSGKVTGSVTGVPPVVSSGQGGLLDVALAPDFAAAGMIYLA